MPKFTTKRFNELCEQLADTQEEAAAMLGIGRRSFVRYAMGHAPVPTGTRRLLLMLIRHPKSPARMEEW